MHYEAPRQSLLRGLALLMLSALLFSAMGVLIRLASHTVNNETVVFMRNVVGSILLLPLLGGLLVAILPASDSHRL